MKNLPEWKNEALLILRLALGAVFLMHGAQMVLGLFGGSGLQATVKDFQTQLGIPALFGYLAALTQFLGGIALLLGALTRLAALGIGVVMGVAIWKVHLVNGFFMNWFCKPGQGHGIECNLALLAIALALVLTGGGKYSFDAKCFSRCEA